MNTPISDVLRSKGSEVFSITPESSVYDAVQRMAEHHVGCLLVQDAKGRIKGIISERDCRDVILQEKSPRKVSVADVMTDKVLHVPPDRTVEECMQIMTERRVRHLPVMTNGSVQGMISIGDVVKYLCSERGLEIENLEKYITGSL